MAKQKIKARVVFQEKIADDIYSLWLSVGAMAKEAQAGQFLSLYIGDGSKILPRPLSICEMDREKEEIRVVYRATGEGTGTAWLSHLRSEDEVGLIGALGNGFPLGKGKKPLLIGGGIGLPPLVELSRALAGEKRIIAGYKAKPFLLKELRENAEVIPASEGGEIGIRGNVMDALREASPKADVIYACGPKPMLRAVKEYAREKQTLCYLSLEERMACGIGACLACVCKSAEPYGKGYIQRKRVCKDGPVFLSSEVEV